METPFHCLMYTLNNLQQSSPAAKTNQSKKKVKCKRGQYTASFKKKHKVNDSYAHQGHTSLKEDMPQIPWILIFAFYDVGLETESGVKYAMGYTLIMYTEYQERKDKPNVQGYKICQNDMKK